MGNTTINNFPTGTYSDFVSLSEMTQVFCGSVTHNNNPTIAITLDVPFEYEGENIVIAVLKNDNNWGYSIGWHKRSGGTWQTSPIFSGLTPNTSYSFTQRKAETATHLASPASPTAQFNTVQTYTITASVNNTNWGSITPGGECVVEDGKSITFSITPTESGKLEDVKVNGASKGAISIYTFENVKANGTIEALFIENVGITENSIGNIHIYPNPTTGELIIDNGQLTITSVEVYDVIGKKVFTSPVSQMSTETVHNISHLQKGLYFVKISTEAGEVVRKILKE